VGVQAHPTTTDGVTNVLLAQHVALLWTGTEYTGPGLRSVGIVLLAWWSLLEG
jgi:hypothetical protein